MNKAG